MIAAAVAAATLFVVLWAMLHSSGDEAPWVPAGLAASVVMLVAIAAREVVMRRAWTRYILEQDRRDLHAEKGSRSHVSSSGSSKHRPMDAHAAQLRSVQKHSAEADAAGDAPEAHLEAYQLCKTYVTSADETLRSGSLSAESRATLRAGQERARSLQKHHLLVWARASSRSLIHEAQRRARLSDRIETAQRALDVIETALKFYPDEVELFESEAAVRDFMASIKVAHWVELAERAAFKGYYTRAIDLYRDALFYLSRENMKEEARIETAERISREIDLLRARLKTEQPVQGQRARARKEKSSKESAT